MGKAKSALAAYTCEICWSLSGEVYLLVIDAHPKWGEVFHMGQTTSTKTIKVLRLLFASYGLPKQVVSDNEPQFASGFPSVYVRKWNSHTQRSPCVE